MHKYRPTFDLPEMEFKKKPGPDTAVVETDLSILFQHVWSISQLLFFISM